MPTRIVEEKGVHGTCIVNDDRHFLRLPILPTVLMCLSLDALKAVPKLRASERLAVLIGFGGRIKVQIGTRLGRRNQGRTPLANHQMKHVFQAFGASKPCSHPFIVCLKKDQCV